MTAIPSYAVGTVSVAANDTVVVGGGGPLWAQTANAMAGDDVVIDGHAVIVQDVTDDNHLVIDPWPYADVAAGAKYKIVQRSPLRYAGGTAMAIVMQLLAGLNTTGLSIIVPPGVAAPDPSLGEENQFALQPSTFKLWLKTGGAWIFQGLYKGLRIRGEWNGADTFEPNDVVSHDGSSYAALTESTSQAPPNATYWTLLAGKGAPGQDGRDGDVGPTGPGYLATSTSPLEIGIGSKTFATQEGLAYRVGARARASSNASGANYMEGLVTAYAGGNLTINVSKFSGAGSFADWNINVAGEPGAGDLLAANNLSDLANKATALNNLSGVSYGAAQPLTAAQKSQAQANTYLAPTIQTFVSGSGTYTAPANVKWIEIRMVGGGGGGGGSSSSTSGGNGGNGGNTTFSTLTAAAGSGSGNAAQGGAGGGAAGGNIANIPGGQGQGSVFTAGNGGGGNGGASSLGSGGGGGAPGNAGTPAPGNSGGGGGGGGGATTGWSAAGGGAGGFVNHIITAPAATYSYVVGTGGTGGTPGTSGFAGGNGAAGQIQVIEHYGS